MLTRARIAVLVSGGGTNLQALLDAQRDGKMPHGEIVLVVSSRAGGLCAHAGGKRGCCGTRALARLRAEAV